MQAEYITLKKQVVAQAKRLEEFECYLRSDNLVIRGLPEQSMAERATASGAMGDSDSISDSHQSVEKTFIAFCHDKLGVDVDSRDISIAHRLKAGTNNSFRLIIVRFTNRRIRNHVYAARKTLKPPKGTRGSKDAVFISEHLTKSAIFSTRHDSFSSRERFMQHGRRID